MKFKSKVSIDIPGVCCNLGVQLTIMKVNVDRRDSQMTGERELNWIEWELNWIEWELNWKSWGNMISEGVNNQQGNQVIISGPRGQSRLAHRTSVSLVCSLVQCVLYVLVHSLFQRVKAHWSNRQKNVVIIFDIKFITWNKQKSIYRLGVVFKGGYVTKWGAGISSYTLKGIRDLLEDRY